MEGKFIKTNIRRFSFHVVYVYASKFIFSVHLCDIVYVSLTHWGRVTHTCISKLTIIVPDNDMSPGYLNNVGLLLIVTFGTNFSEIFSEMHTFSFEKMHLKMSAKWRQFCLDLSVLNGHGILLIGYIDFAHPLSLVRRKQQQQQQQQQKNFADLS